MSVTPKQLAAVLAEPKLKRRILAALLVGSKMTERQIIKLQNAIEGIADVCGVNADDLFFAIGDLKLKSKGQPK